MSKILQFFKSFFANAAADPVSTVKGLTQLAAAGSACYGMATGAVPINQLSIGTATALAASGIHAIGTNSATGIEIPEAAKAEAVVASAAQIAPVALGIVDQVASLKAQAESGQAAVDKFVAISSAITGVLSKDRPDGP